MTKGGSKTPVFGSGDREPFTRGSRGKTFAAPQGKTSTSTKPAPQAGDSSAAKPTVPSATTKQDDKPKSAIEKQAEIAQKCAAAFKGAASPAPDVEMLSTPAAKTPAKPGATPSTPVAKPAAPSTAATQSAAKKKETESPVKAVTTSGKAMTQEERAREDEIQRKIKESVVVVESDKNPTAEEVEKILKTPPGFEVSIYKSLI